MIKRKKRSKVDMEKLDFSKPIRLEDIGSTQDPCFGKHFSLEASECSGCGDAQVCAILVAQKLHTDRSKQGNKQAFLDIEESKLINPQILLSFIVVTFQRSGTNLLPLSKVMERINKRFNSAGHIDRVTLGKLVRKVIIGSPKLSTVKKNEVRYVKLKSAK